MHILRRLRSEYSIRRIIDRFEQNDFADVAEQISMRSDLLKLYQNRFYDKLASIEEGKIYKQVASILKIDEILSYHRYTISILSESLRSWSCIRNSKVKKAMRKQLDAALKGTSIISSHVCNFEKKNDRMTLKLFFKLAAKGYTFKEIDAYEVKDTRLPTFLDESKLTTDELSRFRRLESIIEQRQNQKLPQMPEQQVLALQIPPPQILENVSPPGPRRDTYYFSLM